MKYSLLEYSKIPDVINFADVIIGPKRGFKVIALKELRNRANGQWR